MLQNSLNNLNLTASGKTYLIWTQNLYCSLSLRVKFASSSFALIRHVWLTWSSFLPWLSRIELWVDSPSITEQITNKADRVRKSPISEMAAMLWRNMVIKIDIDPGLVLVFDSGDTDDFKNTLKFYFSCCIWRRISTRLRVKISTLRKRLWSNSHVGLANHQHYSHARIQYSWAVIRKHVFKTSKNNFPEINKKGA